MFLKRNTCFMALLLCSVAVWCRSVSAGSSFLSPSHKPQIRGKSARVGRQMTEEPDQPNGDNLFKISAPFEIGLTLSEQDFEDYGAILQRVLQHLLGDTQPPEPTNSD